MPDELAWTDPTARAINAGLRRFKRGDLIVGRYRVGGELGQGRMGVVYRCHDEMGGVEVGLKALPAEVSRGPVGMDEVLDSFRLVYQLVHEHIAAVRTLELDAATEDYYVIQECVEGISLSRWRQNRAGKVSLEAALPILRQVAAALDFAHSLKILHRDLKPSKVLVRPDGTVKVLFFGLAAQAQSSLSPARQIHYFGRRRKTQRGPPKWRGQYQGTATDQYSLAVMVYELLAGKPPFGLAYPAVLQRGVLQQPPRCPDGLDASAWSALARGLAQNDPDRFENCTEFLAALAGKPPAEVVLTAEAARVAEPEVREEIAQAQQATPQALRLGGPTTGDDLAAASEKELHAKLAAAAEDVQTPEREARVGLASTKPPRAPAEPLQSLPEPAIAQPVEAPDQHPPAPASAAGTQGLQPLPWAEPSLTPIDREPLPPTPVEVPPPCRPGARTRRRWGQPGHARHLARKTARYSRVMTIGVLATLLVLGGSSWYLSKLRKEQDRLRAALVRRANLTKRWYLRASLPDVEAEAVGTNVLAFIELGDRYCWGLAGRVDYNEALRWYRRAAEQKDPAAYGRMGNLCQEAPALAGGREEMLRWYEEGAALGDPSSQIDWGVAIRQGNAGSEPIETAQRLFAVAIPGLRALAATGESMAMDYLGGVFWDGLGVLQDRSEAVRWFERAARLGNASAMNHLGLAYDNGQGFAKDHAEALKWFRQAAELGNGAAMFNLGAACDDASEVTKDQPEAVRWMTKAAALGLAPAMTHLGTMYANGTGVARDDKEAWTWFEKAAAADNGEAMTWLGRFCETGRGFGVDYEAALKWYRKAAALGDLRSKLRLRELNITDGTEPSLNAWK